MQVCGLALTFLIWTSPSNILGMEVPLSEAGMIRMSNRSTTSLILGYLISKRNFKSWILPATN